MNIYMANTIINGQIFAETVKNYMEGAGVLMQIAKVSDYSAEAGSSVKIPKLGFIGNATEVVNGVATYTDVTDTEATANFKQIQKGVKLSDKELKASLIDRTVDARAMQTQDAIVAKIEADLIEELDKAQVHTVTTLNEKAVLDAQGLLGQRLTQRDTYIVANGKVANTLVAAVKSADKSAKATEVYDAKILRFDTVADDTFYLVQQDVLEVLVGKELTTNVYREADFLGEKTSSDMIVAAIVNDDSRVVKVTKSA